MDKDNPDNPSPPQIAFLSGTWSDAEQQRYLQVLPSPQSIKKNGINCQAISKHVGTRSPEQVRWHYRKREESQQYQQNKIENQPKVKETYDANNNPMVLTRQRETEINKRQVKIEQNEGDPQIRSEILRNAAQNQEYMPKKEEISQQNFQEEQQILVKQEYVENQLYDKSNPTQNHLPFESRPETSLDYISQLPPLMDLNLVTYNTLQHSQDNSSLQHNYHIFNNLNPYQQTLISTDLTQQNELQSVQTHLNQLPNIFAEMLRTQLVNNQLGHLQTNPSQILNIQYYLVPLHQNQPQTLPNQPHAGPNHPQINPNHPQINPNPDHPPTP